MSAPPIAFITDIEGMWERLDAFVRDNPYVEWAGTDLRVKPGALFVFGGDAIDRGPWGRRVVATLLEAKRKQPDQVVLLAGNRDLNKLRLTRELTGHPPHKMPDDVRQKSRGDQLKWIFSNTMGASGAFEHRRTELKAERRGDGDDDVVQSFLDDVSDEGPIREYLREAQLALRVGPTLFVHGGVTEESLLHVPNGVVAKDVGGWIDALNGWYVEQLEAVDEGRLDADGRPVWTQLMAYQAPVPGTRLNQGSVVYGRTADDKNNPLLPEQNVRQRLIDEGIFRLVVGHTPNGDSPSILRAKDFEQIVADTSYANVKEGPKLLIEGDRTRCDGYAVLDDVGRQHVSFDVELGDDSPIGRRLTANGALLKAQLDNGDYASFWYEPKFKAVTKSVAAKDVRPDTIELPDAPFRG